MTRSKRARFCWCGMPLSVVTKTSNSSRASASSSPFSLPLQPRSTTVRIWWPSPKVLFRRRSTFSSSSTRKVGRLQGHLQVRDGLLATHTGESVQEVLQGVTGLEVIDQRLYGDAGSGEDELAMHHP